MPRATDANAVSEPVIKLALAQILRHNANASAKAVAPGSKRWGGQRNITFVDLLDEELIGLAAGRALGHMLVHLE
jgi:hypothetical protein